MPLVNGKNISPDEAILLGRCPECGTAITPREVAAHAASHYFGRDPNDPWFSEEARRRYRLMLDFAAARCTANEQVEPRTIKFSPKPFIIAIPAFVIIALAAEPLIAGVWQFMSALPKGFIAAIAVAGLLAIGLAFLSDHLFDRTQRIAKVISFVALFCEAGFFIYGVYSYYPPSSPSAPLPSSSNTDRDALSKALTIIDKLASQKSPSIASSGSITASIVVIPGWPQLKPQTIDAIKSRLAEAGKHEFDLFLCSSHDCDVFGEGFRAAMLGAGWFQRPDSVSQIQWKLASGWVVVGYGDKAGMDALHDAVKQMLHVDVPTLDYPARAKEAPYVQFMIGPRPDDLLQLTP